MHTEEFAELHNQQDLLIDLYENKWVWTYDHHSIWISNWVGEQNRRAYFFTVTLMYSQFTLGMVLTYFRLDKDTPYSTYLSVWLIIAAISQMFIFPILSFTVIFQLYLVCFRI